MKIEEIVEIIFELENEEVAKEFITEVKKEYGGVLPISNTFNIHNSFIWPKSNLGFEFWSELHEKISDYLVGSILQHQYEQ